MSHRLEMEAWKTFINGLLAQEEGREEDGLRAFERALELEPGNPHFQSACESARRRQENQHQRSDAEVLAHVQTCYQRLAGFPERAAYERIEGLKGLLAELEPQRDAHQRKYLTGLHS